MSGPLNGLAARGELPDAAVSESGVKITALASTVPEEAGVLMRRAYALLPHIKITEVAAGDRCMDELQSTLHPLKDR